MLRGKIPPKRNCRLEFLPLCPLWARQQRFDGSIDAEAAIDDRSNGLRDRHVDALGRCHARDGGGREDALRHRAPAAEHPSPPHARK